MTSLVVSSRRVSRFALSCLMIFGPICAARDLAAWERPRTNVPPTLEIEVLDPGVDPLGNPAVMMRPGEFGSYLEIDIPPTILVHRYYYTGDRSFQAQILPGGPSIVVANHPKTGERCYVPVQLLPGAPRVTYTSGAIDFDYGRHGIAVCFGAIGKPTVKYRNGTPWSKRIAKAIHLPRIQEGASAMREQSRHVTETTTSIVKEVCIDTGEVVDGLALPVKNTLRLLPFGTALMDPNRAELRAAKIAEHERRTAIEQVERRTVADDISIPTLR